MQTFFCSSCLWAFPFFVSLIILQLPLSLISQSVFQGTRRRSAVGGVQAASTTCLTLEHSESSTLRRSECGCTVPTLPSSPSNCLACGAFYVFCQMHLCVQSFLPLLLLLLWLNPSFSYPTSEWKECPEYIHANRECFFDMNHTAIWVTYCMQLRSQNNITYYNEDDCFTVENIG